MDFFQWAITTIVGILGILAGRAWERYDRKNQKDKEILDQLINMLKYEISYCRNTYFGNTFDWDKLIGLSKYRVKCEEPDFFFLDNELEKLRKELLTSIEEFINKLSISSFVVNLNIPSLARIPQEDEDEIHGQNAYITLSRELDNLANNVCKTYDEIVRAGRIKL